MGVVGAVCLASSSYAAKVSNSFVTVEGEGVGILDDESIPHDENSTGDITVMARPRLARQRAEVGENWWGTVPAKRAFYRHFDRSGRGTRCGKAAPALQQGRGHPCHILFGSRCVVGDGRVRKGACAFIGQGKRAGCSFYHAPRLRNSTQRKQPGMRTGGVKRVGDGYAEQNSAGLAE